MTELRTAGRLSGSELGTGGPSTYERGYRRARGVVLALAGLATATLVALAYLDWRVYGLYGLDQLDAVISAEASAVGTILAVTAAIVGVWIYFRPKAAAAFGP